MKPPAPLRSVIAVALAAVAAAHAPALSKVEGRAVNAQTPATEALAFEVASIRLNRDINASESSSVQPGGRVRLTGFHPITLILAAYATDTVQTAGQFIGGPSWLYTDRYDIVAKAEGDLMLNAEGRRPARAIAMLKKLLEDRFGVRIHTESRRMPVFALRLSRRDRRPGPELHTSTVQCPGSERGAAPAAADRWCGFRREPGSVTARFVTMPEVATFFSSFLVVGRPVTDRTGLAGRYDLRVEYMEGPDDAGSLFTAFNEQLGLAFQPERAVMPVIVIDRAERPTPD